MDENAVEKLLIGDWASGLRITTVPQAMNRLGFADDLKIRWEMSNRMDALWHSTLETPEKIQAVNSAIGIMTDEERAALAQYWRDQVATWDRASILLTDNEKLIARQILWCQRSGLRRSSPEDIEAALAIGPEETANGIRMLTWLGFLALPDGQPLKNYTLAEDQERFLDGLGFSFHTVTLDDGERFGIP